MINNTSLSANTSLRTAIKNDLRLNYQTRIWLDVISAPAVELKEKIEKAMEDNPFLEYDFKSSSQKSSSSSADINSIIENTVDSGKESLFSHLKSQIEITFDNKKEIELAQQICSFINQDGYLTISNDEISNILNVSISEVEKIVSIIKTFDPYGVAAKNINECLAIQLRIKKKESKEKDLSIYDIAINIVEHYLDKLSKKDYDYIASNIGVEKDTIIKALKLIQTLEPYPAREYDTSTVKYIVPELFILKENGIWLVKTDETFISPLKISKKYIKLLDREKSKDSINFLKEKKKEAESLINATNERKKTLLKIGEALLKFQIDFFEYGKEFIKPLTLKDMSLEVDLSESTISRIANGKYLNTVWGTFSIKYFFSRAISGGLGSRSVKEIIKRIIENSPTKLSDEKIRLILKSEGIEISRRTIAKYRNSMNIFSSRNR